MKGKCLRLRTPKTAYRLFLSTVSERGAELLEFAFILPVLLTLLLGTFWLGRAYNVYQTITRAAREGARYAVLPDCATCGNVYPDSYTTAGTCLSNPTNVFTQSVKPYLTASSIDPTKVQNYCQEAQWLDQTSDSNVDPNLPQQCGVIISFQYPVQLTIPFTSLDGTTINIKTQVQMRMENQSITTSGGATCP